MDQQLKQKKIALVQSEYMPIVFEILKDCLIRKPLIGKTEYETLVNAVTLDVESSLILRLKDYVELVKSGEFLTND